MINNQVHSPLTDKNNMMTGQASGEAKNEAGKQQGGLFKLLMNSVQGETLNGKGGQSGAGNILGGNLTLKTEQEGDSKQSALQLLAGSGEENKEEQITLSRLLEGSGSETEESSGTAADGSETPGDAVEAESDDKSGESDDGLTEAVTAEGKPAEEKEVSSDGDDQALTSEKVSEDKTAGESAAGKTADTIASGGASATNGEQSAAAGQAASLAGDGAVNQNASHKEGGKTTGGKTPLSGLVQGQESAAGGKQAAGGDVLPGDKIVNGDVPTGSREQSAIGGSIPEGRGNTKSEGLVNELRAFAAARGEHLPAIPNESNLRAEETNDQAGTEAADEGELLQNIFSALQTGSIEQAAAEIRSLKASQMRETRFSNYMASFANRQEITVEGSAEDSGSTISSGASTTTLSMMPATAMVPTGASVSSELFDENAAVLWKEQITEYFESKDKSFAENQAAAAFARLGDVPVTNISVRRSFAQGISQAILNATGNGKQGAEVWQKHNFMLEDGKNIQVAAREVDGVLQLKLSSSASELNKLLLEHEKEIRELLENELELKIDLQMDGGGDGNVADFFGGSNGQQSSGKGGNSPLDLDSLRRTEEKQVEKVVPQAVRKFGYNQNEWTV